MPAPRQFATCLQSQFIRSHGAGPCGCAAARLWQQPPSCGAGCLQVHTWYQRMPTRCLDACHPPRAGLYQPRFARHQNGGRRDPKRAPAGELRIFGCIGPLVAGGWTHVCLPCTTYEPGRLQAGYKLATWASRLEMGCRVAADKSGLHGSSLRPVATCPPIPSPAATPLRYMHAPLPHLALSLTGKRALRQLPAGS